MTTSAYVIVFLVVFAIAGLVLLRWFFDSLAGIEKGWEVDLNSDDGGYDVTPASWYKPFILEALDGPTFGTEGRAFSNDVLTLIEPYMNLTADDRECVPGPSGPTMVWKTVAHQAACELAADGFITIVPGLTPEWTLVPRLKKDGPCQPESVPSMAMPTPSGFCQTTRTPYYLPLDIYRVAAWIIRYKHDGRVPRGIVEEVEPFFRPSLTAGDRLVSGVRKQTRFNSKLSSLRNKMLAAGYLRADSEGLLLTSKGESLALFQAPAVLSVS